MSDLISRARRAAMYAVQSSAEADLSAGAATRHAAEAAASSATAFSNLLRALAVQDETAALEAGRAGCRQAAEAAQVAAEAATRAGNYAAQAASECHLAKAMANRAAEGQDPGQFANLAERASQGARTKAAATAEATEAARLAAEESATAAAFVAARTCPGAPDTDAPAPGPGSPPPSEPERCAICQDGVTEPMELPCGHAYCRECISTSFQHTERCPVCRATVPFDFILSIWGFNPGQPESEPASRSAEFEVQAILGHRRRRAVVDGRPRRMTEYLVRWAGHPASEDSWVWVGDLRAPALLAEYRRNLPATEATEDSDA